MLLQASIRPVLAAIRPAPQTAMAAAAVRPKATAAIPHRAAGAASTRAVRRHRPPTPCTGEAVGPADHLAAAILRRGRPVAIPRLRRAAAVAPPAPSHHQPRDPQQQQLVGEGAAHLDPLHHHREHLQQEEPSHHPSTIR
jgi:hypothetical protein